MARRGFMDTDEVKRMRVSSLFAQIKMNSGFLTCNNPTLLKYRHQQSLSAVPLSQLLQQCPQIFRKWRFKRLQNLVHICKT